MECCKNSWKNRHSAIPSLLGALRDSDSNVKFGASDVLINMGSTAVPDLIRVLKDEKGFLRPPPGSASKILGKIGPAAIPALIEALKDPDPKVQIGAANALGDIGPEAKDATPALIRVFTDRRRSKDNVGRATSYALGEIGPAAEDAMPELTRELQKGLDIRFSVAFALKKINPGAKNGVPAMIELLKDKSDYAVWSAAKILGQTGISAVPSLLDILNNPDSKDSAKFGAILALRDIGPPAKDAVPLMIAELKNRSPAIRYTSADALGKIGAAAKDAVPHLFELLNDQDVYVRDKAAIALGKIDPAAKVQD